MTKYKNSFAEHTNVMVKFRDYNRDRRAGVLAHCSDGSAVPLSSLKLSQVEFVAGLWRVQNPFPHKVQMVRGAPFVLGERLPHAEKNLFEFYRAFRVSENCYGPFMVPGNQIVAKYTTDHGTYWSYGNTIEQARAFLGIKLYDEYMDLIHAHACKNQLARQKK